MYKIQCCNNLLGTSVHLLIHAVLAISNAENHEDCWWPDGLVSVFLKTCDLPGFSHTTVSRVFTQNGVKRAQRKATGTSDNPERDNRFSQLWWAEKVETGDKQWTKSPQHWAVEDWKHDECGWFSRHTLSPLNGISAKNLCWRTWIGNWASSR